MKQGEKRETLSSLDLDDNSTFPGARRGGQRESSHFRRDSQRGVSSLSCWLDASKEGK